MILQKRCNDHDCEVEEEFYMEQFEVSSFLEYVEYLAESGNDCDLEMLMFCTNLKDKKIFQDCKQAILVGAVDWIMREDIEYFKYLINLFEIEITEENFEYAFYKIDCDDINEIFTYFKRLMKIYDHDFIRNKYHEYKRNHNNQIIEIHKEIRDKFKTVKEIRKDGHCYRVIMDQGDEKIVRRISFKNKTFYVEEEHIRYFTRRYFIVNKKDISKITVIDLLCLFDDNREILEHLLHEIHRIIERGDNVVEILDQYFKEKYCNQDERLPCLSCCDLDMGNIRDL